MAKEKMAPRLLVLELRQNADNTMSNTVTSFDADKIKEATNKYYVVCGAAAISDKPIYTVMLMNTDGFVLKMETFVNEIETATVAQTEQA